MVVLKRLSAAQRDGDTILAVIRGTAINQDGRSSGLTAPSGPAQQRVIRRALADGGVDPGQVGYIEAHGTGTHLGDPIEIGALNAVFHDRSDPLWVGSVKTNFGHLEATAGVAGLIKVILGLQQGKIPPNLHFHTPNPYIDWQDSPVKIPTTLIDWPAAQCIAGISSFGISGTNAHLVVEAAPALSITAPPQQRDQPYQLLPLSAKSADALLALVNKYQAFLANNQTTLPDLCYSAQVGRSHFEYRLGLVADSVQSLQAKLAAVAADWPANGAAALTSPDVSRGFAPAHQPTPKIAFLFTGQGDQYVGMGRELYASEASFRATLDRCEAIAQEALGRSLHELLYPAAPPDHHDLQQSHPCAQAANFALQCALVALWRSWGIQPDYVLGHSLGDFAAAYAAGVLSLEDGLRLVIKRGQLMATATGAMLWVLTTEERVAPYLTPYADIAVGVISGPRSLVLSGGAASMHKLAAELYAAGFTCRPLDIPVAAHSPLLDPVLADFEAAVRNVTLHPPQITVVSSMTGQVVTTELTDPAYWRRQLRNTVRFADGVQTLHAHGCTAFLEIGPKPTLLNLVEQTLDAAPGSITEATDQPATLSPCHPLLLPSLREGRSDQQQILSSLGALYAHGTPIDWQWLHQPAQRRKVTLPTYPFQRQSYWVKRSKAGHDQSATAALRPLVQRMLRLPQQKALIFESDFSVAALPFLADHRVFDTVISPGACQLATVLTAVDLARPTACIRLTDVTLPQTLVLPTTGERTVQLHLAPVAAPSAERQQEFTLISFDPASPETQPEAQPEVQPPTHLQGYLATIADTPTITLRTLQQRFASAASVNLDNFYGAQMATSAVALGPSFQWLTRLWRQEVDGRVETLGELHLPMVIEEFARYLLHPALLDGAFHVATSATTTMATDASTEGSATMLPFALRALHFYKPAPATPPQQSWWCHATAVAPYQWDLTLFDSAGNLLLTVAGFTVRPATPEAVQGKSVWRDWLYQLRWQPRAVVAAPPEHELSPAAKAPATWLLFADSGALGETVADRLRKGGATVTLVQAGAAWASGEGERFVINPTVVADYEQLLATQSHFDQILYLWGLDLPTPAADPSVAVAAQQGCDALLHLVQALLHQRVTPKNFWLVTQNAQQVIDNDTVTGVPQAALWGMGKTIALEHPELNCRLLDLGDEAGASQVALLYATLHDHDPALRAEKLLALRTQPNSPQCYVARLTRADAKPTEALTISKAGSYLITGGANGIGLVIARWLAEQGAGHLLLVGRSQPKAAAEAQLAAIRALGTELTIAQADVTNRPQLAQLIAEVDARYPLRGVVHSAGVLDDGAILHQRPERFARVLAPKVLGAWHLHELTKAHHLNFFVLFSSGAGLLGSRGQANHAAANSWLDAFAHYRQAQGLPALSINWGAWAEVGAAADLVRNNQAQMAAQGLGFMTPAQGIAAFGALLQQALTQVAVLPIAWHKRQQSEQVADPFYTEFIQSPAATATGAAPTSAVEQAVQASFRQQVEASPLAERRPLLVAHIQATVAKILGMSATPAAKVGFTELGMDSLMALELRRRLERTLQLTLPSTIAFEYPTTERLATYLLQEALAAPSSMPDTPLVNGVETLSVNGTAPAVAVGALAAETELSGEELLAFIAQEFKEAFQ